MEPLTHFLTGAVLGRAGLNRTTALATLTLTLAAEAPDIDVVAHFGGDVFAFAHHRGITHTFLGAPLVAGLTVAIVYAGHRLSQRWRKGRPPRRWFRKQGSGNPASKAPPRWGVLFVLACLGVLSHILLDYTNNYGVHPFTPFHNRWYSWDIVFIIEPVLHLILLGGLLLPGLFGLIHEEIGVRRNQPPGRTGAILALAAIIVFWGFRDVQHRRAVDSLGSRYYHGEAPVRVSAFPYYVNPFRWYGVVETDEFYVRTVVNSLNPDADVEAQSSLRYKEEETPVTLAAKDSYLGRVYLDWAQHPVLETMPLPPPRNGYVVRFLDLRFMWPERENGALGAYALLDADLNVVDSWFGGLLSRPDLTAPEAVEAR